MHTWFLSVDLQYHCISLIVMIALHKNIKFGFIINLLLITGFTLLSAIITFIYDFAPGVVNTGREYEISKKQIEI